MAIIIQLRQISVHSVGTFNGPPPFGLDLALKTSRGQM